MTSPQPNLPDRLRQRRRLERRRRLTAGLIVLVPTGLLVVLLLSGTQQGQGPASDKRALTRPGSNPSVLPGDVLIADRGNNRLLELDPAGHVVWQFPRPGDLRPGQTFKSPDDAFFDPSGQFVVATQEDDFVISVIDVRRHRIVYRYGRPGVPGATPNRLNNPDDAIPMTGGTILSADIKNCRLIILRPPSHAPVRQLGSTGLCLHNPPLSFASPNGAFPTSSGATVVTEISGNWIDLLAPSGKLISATHPPGFSYPSDTNEVKPGLFLSADYVDPGAIEMFDLRGRLKWRYAPKGRHALDKPSLALPLPNGDVLANDDDNNRVIVVNPRTDQIVWQYGYTSRPGRGPGYLNDPDGLDLAPPYSLLRQFPSARPPG
ncbi:MAG TPA: hypothetical protein VLS25_12115 [Dehalococcoidia bacterium]|nr:hypothetical protein [Dehalococcoidia bacterium]